MEVTWKPNPCWKARLTYWCFPPAFPDACDYIAYAILPPACTWTAIDVFHVTSSAYSAKVGVRAMIYFFLLLTLSVLKCSRHRPLLHEQMEGPNDLPSQLRNLTRRTKSRTTQNARISLQPHSAPNTWGPSRPQNLQIPFNLRICMNNSST